VIGHFSYYRKDPDDVRSHAEWGGGALLDIGCYPVTISRWLFGEEPLDVVAAIEQDPDLGVDRLTSGILRFRAGHASFTCAGQLSLWQRVQVFGTKGRIDVEIPFNTPAARPSRLYIDDGRGLAGEGIETLEFPAVNQYTLQADAFARAVRGEGEVPVPLEDAIANMQILDALVRSGRSGRWERTGTGASGPALAADT
jgi:predicted dehydrogenase